MIKQQEKRGRRRFIKNDSIRLLRYQHNYWTRHCRHLSLLLLIIITFIIPNNNNFSWVMAISDDSISKIQENTTTSIIRSLLWNDDYYNTNNKDNTIVSTLLCSRVRAVRTFTARLELDYFYSIETTTSENTASNNALKELSHAILRAILQALHRCNKKNQPQYALDRSIHHKPAKEGNCFPS